MTREQIESFQKDANRWTQKYLLDVGKLKVDGQRGHATNRRILTIKWYLGYGQSRDAKLTKTFLGRMEQPKNPNRSPKAMIQEGERRRREQKKGARESRHPTSGIVTIDGKPCAAWIAEIIKAVRAGGRWKGWLVSGFRSPEHSEHLCQNMCGANSCPGRCAGRSSNHTQHVKPGGAIDVSDYVVFGQECKRLGMPIFNALGPADPVHFSSSGR